MPDNSQNKPINKSFQNLLVILQKQKMIESLVHNQATQHHDLVETLVKKENSAQLKSILQQLSCEEITGILENLNEDDQLLVWNQLSDGNKQSILNTSQQCALGILSLKMEKSEKPRIKAYKIETGKLQEIIATSSQDLLNESPVWIDLVSPTFEDRLWLSEIFDIDVPDPERLNDLESSARFYVNDKGDIHLHSDFLLGKDEISRNVAVAFILYQDILFSIRSEELSVFRLQRFRAFSQPNYVTNAKELLLDLYAANAEYFADGLENIYLDLEQISSRVLNNQMSDENAAQVLVTISNQEDLNGRIRRNAMDTRRAVVFLLRSKLLTKEEVEYSQQILRDIDSLDGHTAFLSDKINFLMDSTVGFININQNKVVKRLTVVSVVFMPLNMIASIGGMSEFTMMTKPVPWPIAYAIFSMVLAFIGWLTFSILQKHENRKRH
jgi:magnesium transporter